MVSMLDKSVGKVIAALREKNMLENSIVVFLSDNGAPVFGIHANHGSNYPLRGVSGLKKREKRDDVYVNLICR